MDKASWKCPPCKISDPRSMRSDSGKTTNHSTKSPLLTPTNTPKTATLSPGGVATSNDQLLEQIQISMLNMKSDILGELHEAHKELLLSLSSRIEENNRKCDQLKTENAKILETLTFVAKQYDTVVEKVKELDPLKKKCEDLAANNKGLIDKIGKLEDKFEEMDQLSRKKNLEFRNVPESENENLVEIMKKIGSVIGCPLQSGDIENIYRVSSRVPTGKRRTIIVKFPSILLCDKFLKAIKSYNKAARTKDGKLNSEVIQMYGKTPIFVSEHLTPKMKLLYAETRKFARENHYKYSWISFGKIYLRKDDNQKIVHIISTHMLNELLL